MEIPSVLAVLAHPDDEITIAPVLARIKREGGEVRLVFAPSGDAGPGSSCLEPGEALAELRANEARCSAFSLGLDEPVFWELGDGTLATMARTEDSAAKQAIGLIAEAIRLHKPSVVMTWGPDGGYGHSDHRMISAAVTQVIAGLGPQRPDLLYAAFPQTEAQDLPEFERWATVHPDLITDRIRYQRSDLDAARDALACYQSQFPAPVREALIPMLHERVWRGAVTFRLAFPSLR